VTETGRGIFLTSKRLVRKMDKVGVWDGSKTNLNGQNGGGQERQRETDGHRESV